MKCLVPFALAITLAAQDPQFDVQSRLVLVPVTVTTGNGRTVDGLELKDFLMLDNGRPQKATVDTNATGVAPIALVVAIQASGISAAVLEKVEKIGGMVQPFVTGERGCAAVVTFSERITWLQECTNNDTLISRAFQQVRPGGPKSARMLDAVYESIDKLRPHRNSRRVLLLISESRDRGSETALAQVIAAAQTAGVSVYAATYSAFATAFTTKSPPGEREVPHRPKTPREITRTESGGAPRCGLAGCPDPYLPPPEQRLDILGGIGELVRLGKTNDTQALTGSTGGAVFSFARLKGLEEAIQKLGAELHSQYLLSFTPDDPTPGYHRLEVRVPTGDFLIRARPGYWSVQAPGR